MARAFSGMQELVASIPSGEHAYVAQPALARLAATTAATNAPNSRDSPQACMERNDRQVTPMQQNVVLKFPAAFDMS